MNNSPADGHLALSVSNPSHFLSQNLPYVIRDAGRAVKHHGSGSAEIPLEPGVYSISAIGPDGEQERQLFQIHSGKTTDVIVGSPPQAPGPVTHGPPQQTTRSGPGHRGDGGQRAPATRGFESAPMAAETGSAPFRQPVPRVVKTQGCSVISRVDEGLIVVPTEPVEVVPTVLAEHQGRRWQLSMPVNPQGNLPENSCLLTLVGDEATARPQARFAVQRRVANLLDGALRRGREAELGGMLQDASSLLMSKYRDPPAAALGGLTLHRLGHLTERRTWIDNLARDFSWIADGQILRAALLLDGSANDRRAGLEMLLDASVRRPMFTGGLSLALELLRRWPSSKAGKDDQEARQDRLQSLAEYAAWAEWDMVSLTTRVPDTRSSARRKQAKS